MVKSDGIDHQTELRKKIGGIFLVLAAIGLLWICDSIYKLWNVPKSVPIVTMFVELSDTSDSTLLVFGDGKELNLPKSWPVVAGVFLGIVLISSAGLVVRSLITVAIALLFPELKMKKFFERKGVEKQR